MSICISLPVPLLCFFFSHQVCGVCHEQLEQFWEEDEEEWHFKDALRTPDDALYHSYCYVDSKEVRHLIT